LWSQVAALPFDEQLALAERIQSRVPDIPPSALQVLSTTELRAELDRSHQEVLDHPERSMSIAETFASIRSELAL